MKRISVLLLLLLTLNLYGLAQANRAADLETVLQLMDKTAAGFRTLQADFTWDQFTRVVSNHDYQSGVMYFMRRSNKDVEMAAVIKQPILKYVLFNSGVVQVYEPKINQVTRYDVGKNRADFQSYLVLGFGGGGHELEKTFTVRFAGTDPGVSNAYKLELVPKSEKARATFSLITLWIDSRGLAVQQKFDESSGDYRLAQYSNVSQKVSKDAFSLHTEGKNPRIVQPRSGP